MLRRTPQHVISISACLIHFFARWCPDDCSMAWPPSIVCLCMVSAVCILYLIIIRCRLLDEGWLSWLSIAPDLEQVSRGLHIAFLSILWCLSSTPFLAFLCFFPLQWTFQYHPVDVVLSGHVTKVGNFSFLYCWNYVKLFVYHFEDIFIFYLQSSVHWYF